MKRSFLMFAFFSVASACFAQTQCSKDNPLFKFDNATTPNEIHTLGSAPEFPFLGNKSSARQVYYTIKRCERDHMHPQALAKLNEMLMQIGFANGIDDLTPSSITRETLPSGTVGNMGSRGYTVAYSKLDGNPDGYRSWKISSGSGCYMYLLARCGNTFFPQNADKTACIDAPVNLTSQPQEVTVNNVEGNKVNQVYVYYHIKGKRHRHAMAKNAMGRDDVPDSHPSVPLLLSSVKKANVVPETYKITVSTPDDHLKVCPDQTVDVAANINVEKTSEYTGNYPGTEAANSEYRKVSKRIYKKSLRKVSKAMRKENKVAKITHVHVNR